MSSKKTEKSENSKESSPSKKGKVLATGKTVVKDSSALKLTPVAEKSNTGQVAKTDVISDKMTKMMADLIKNVELSMKKHDAKLSKITSRLDDVDKQFQDLYSYDEQFMPEMSESGSSFHGESVDLYTRKQGSDDDIESEDDHSTSKRKSDGQESRFSSLAKKFKTQEITDNAVDDTLAEHVNDFFTKRIDDSKYAELIKDENNARPENCSGLVLVKCNNIIWEGLSGTAKTTDRKLQALETTIVKASTLLVKSVHEMSLLEKEDDKYGKEIDRCLEVLALLGHDNRQVNLARRDLLKPELKEEYVPLCNHNLPFTDELFGNDVSKTAREIEEVAKIRQKINRRTSFQRPRPYSSLKSGFYNYPRGRRHFFRGSYLGSSTSHRDSRLSSRPRDSELSKNYGQRRGSKLKQ